MIGSKKWAIGEGYIPETPEEKDPRFIGHETACILNDGDQDAHIQIMIYFSDREPVGPYRLTVHAKRTYHLRFNDLEKPSIPHETNYSSVIESDVPIVVQYTRLDTRRGHEALISTTPYSA